MIRFSDHGLQQSPGAGVVKRPQPPRAAESAPAGTKAESEVPNTETEPAGSEMSIEHARSSSRQSRSLNRT